MIVSFGSSVARARREIESVEKALRETAPGRDFFRAYTSPTIRRILAAQGEAIPDLCTALEHLSDSGYTDVVVGVTHLLYGIEYEKIQKTAAMYADRFERFMLGRPLVADSESLCELAQCLPACYPSEQDALVFLGHGTEHFSNMMYPALQTALRLEGVRNAYIGTVEGWPGFSEVLRQLQADGVRSVLLAPLMLVAGDHAQNDMAGDTPDSWKSCLQASGIKVSCRMDGLGSLPCVQQLYCAHLRKLLRPEECNGL